MQRKEEDTKDTENRQYSLLDHWLSSKDAANYLKEKVQVADSSDELRKIFEEDLVGKLETRTTSKTMKAMDIEEREIEEKDMDADESPVLDEVVYETPTPPGQELSLWINKPFAMTINTDDDIMLPTLPLLSPNDSNATNPKSPHHIPSPEKDSYPFIKYTEKSKLKADRGTPPRSPTASTWRTPKHCCLSPIKPFYFGPNGAPQSPNTQQREDVSIAKAFAAKEGDHLNLSDFREAAASITGFSSYVTAPLYECCKGPDGKVTEESFTAFWKKHMQNIDDPAKRLFRILILRRERLKPDKHRNYLVEDDFQMIVQDVLHRHPGLRFLKDSTNFHEKYVETVIGRIFFHINRRGNNNMSLKELQKSNLMEVLALLDRETDINEIFDYFSYEHFYVIYCKFWELDTDHDFIIDKEQLKMYGDFALTERVVDRILSGIPRKLHSKTPNTMSYRDFIPFVIAEEDKNQRSSIEYWFRVLDTDGDGILSTYELEWFFEEQKSRIQEVSNEPINFADFMCQLNDMIAPERNGHFRVKDLIKSKMAFLFFNITFNLPKFAQYEQRDPYLITEARRTPQMSDWDRFAVSEYIRYAEDGE